MRDDNFLENDFYNDEMSFSKSPSSIDYSTFEKKGDPKTEVEAFKLSLMGAYKSKRKVLDEDGESVEVEEIKFKKNFKPLINKQGIEEITDLLKGLVNTHTTQANFLTTEKYNSSMKFTFNRIITIFFQKKWDWAIPPAKQVNRTNLQFIYIKIKNLAKLILTRPINDGERIHNSDVVKETIHTNKTPEQKQNLLQKAAGVLK